MLHAALTDMAQALHAIADAQARIAAKPKLTLHLDISAGARREDILRNQADAELEALARKLVPKLKRNGL
jgi:hypothetical protein